MGARCSPTKFLAQARKLITMAEAADALRPVGTEPRDNVHLYWHSTSTADGGDDAPIDTWEESELSELGSWSRGGGFYRVVVDEPRAHVTCQYRAPGDRDDDRGREPSGSALDAERRLTASALESARHREGEAERKLVERENRIEALKADKERLENELAAERRRVKALEDKQTEPPSPWLPVAMQAMEAGRGAIEMLKEHAPKALQNLLKSNPELRAALAAHLPPDDERIVGYETARRLFVALAREMCRANVVIRDQTVMDLIDQLDEALDTRSLPPEDEVEDESETPDAGEGEAEEAPPAPAPRAARATSSPRPTSAPRSAPPSAPPRRGRVVDTTIEPIEFEDDEDEEGPHGPPRRGR